MFNEALNIIKDDAEIQEYYKEVVVSNGCDKYEAHDFPVTEIISVFLASYTHEQEKRGVPENLRLGHIQLGRKDMIEYNKYVEKFNSQLISKAETKKESWNKKGIGGKLLTGAATLAVKGIAKATTGKSEAIRILEKDFLNYLCGDSEAAKQYLLKFANEFGGDDEGLLAVVKAIRDVFTMTEFAKYNRSK